MERMNGIKSKLGTPNSEILREQGVIARHGGHAEDDFQRATRGYLMVLNN
jgi:hypothetical protein